MCLFFHGARGCLFQCIANGVDASALRGVAAACKKFGLPSSSNILKVGVASDNGEYGVPVEKGAASGSGSGSGGSALNPTPKVSISTASAPTAKEPATGGSGCKQGGGGGSMLV